MEEEFKFPDETSPSATVQEVPDLDIEVVDDTPEKDRGRKALDKPVTEPTDEELEAYSDKVQARIKELTHARHDERRKAEAVSREKQELERVARQILEENQQLRRYVSTGEQQFVETYKSGATRELELAKRAYKDAYDAGDTEALIAAQEAMTEAKFKLHKAADFKPTPLQAAESGVQSDSQNRQAPPPPAQVDYKTEQWQAKNQWFGAPGNEEMTSFALGLHQKLVNSGVDPRSDEYFERIDARMKAVFPSETQGADIAGSSRLRAVVAPASRSSGAKKVQLTATQVTLAKKLGLTPQQYAVELVKLEKQNG